MKLSEWYVQRLVISNKQTNKTTYDYNTFFLFILTVLSTKFQDSNPCTLRNIAPYNFTKMANLCTHSRKRLTSLNVEARHRLHCIVGVTL